MMLNIKIIELNEVFWRYLPIGLLISSIFILEIFFLLFNQKFYFFSFLNMLFSLNFVPDLFFFSFNLTPFFDYPVISLSIEFVPSLVLKYGYFFVNNNDTSGASIVPSSLVYFESSEFFVLNDFYY